MSYISGVCHSGAAALRRLSQSNLVLCALLLGAVAFTAAAVYVDARAGNVPKVAPFGHFHGRLVDADNVADVGDLPHGGLGRFHFDIRNTSGTAIKLLEGRRSCACVLSQLPKGVLLPGNVASITGTLEGKGDDGPDMQSFAVSAVSLRGSGSADAPAEEVIPFRVTGNVHTELGLSTSRIHVKTTPTTRRIFRRKFSLKWWAPSNAKLKIESSELPSGTSFEFSPASKAGNGLATFPVTMVVDPTQARTRSSRSTGFAMFRIESDADDSPLFVLHVIIDSLNDVVPIPNFVSWSSADQYAPVTVSLDAADDIDVQIVGVHFDKNVVRCRIAKGDDESELKLECVAKNPSRIIRSELEIDVRYGPDHQSKVIAVPILII